MIARLAMVRIAKRDVKSHEHQGICTPYVAAFVAAENERALECMVYRRTNMMFQVDLRGCSYRVSLEKRTCSCRKWDITGISCEHAYGVILSKKLQVDDYVSHWFRTAMWRRTYTNGVIPMRGAWFWSIGSDALVHEPLEPPQPGQRKKSKKEKRNLCLLCHELVSLFFRKLETFFIMIMKLLHYKYIINLLRTVTKT